MERWRRGKEGLKEGGELCCAVYLPMQRSPSSTSLASGLEWGKGGDDGMETGGENLSGRGGGVTGEEQQLRADEENKQGKSEKLVCTG